LHFIQTEGVSEGEIEMATKPMPKIEKSGVLPNMWRITPPDGYKFDLWSFGRYGMNVILRKKE